MMFGVELLHVPTWL